MTNLKKMKKKKVVFLQGAFEIINGGHVQAFKLARSYGDYLIVGLNTNKLITLYKQRKPVMSWNEKASIIRAMKWVDKVVPAPNFSPIELLKKFDVDVYCLTEEWSSSKKVEFKYMAHKPDGEIKFLPRFKGATATSIIKKILLKEAEEGYFK